MDKKTFVSSLEELSKKYSVVNEMYVSFRPGRIVIRCGKGRFAFVYDFAADGPEPDAEFVPMLHWRNKRKYTELKSILDAKIIEDPRGMRIHHIVPRDEFAASLKNLIIYETDLAEFLTGQSVRHIFADFTGDVYTNCIASTSGNIKISMELGFSPAGSEPVLLHEVIARTGIASDLAVDTQMVQYPIYVINGERVTHYNEIDNELYGLDNTQAECIRYILDVLRDTGSVAGLQAQYRHLNAVYAAAQRTKDALKYEEVV